MWTARYRCPPRDVHDRFRGSPPSWSGWRVLRGYLRLALRKPNTARPAGIRGTGHRPAFGDRSRELQEMAEREGFELDSTNFRERPSDSINIDSIFSR